jgi:cytochrome b subunit of formate dehydrogenase
MKKLHFFFILIFTALIFIHQNSYSQSKDDCLVCHDDPEFTTERNGREISLNVSEDVFNASVHGRLSCVACHTGFDPEEEPHKNPITKVRCLSCHEKAKQKHLFHPQILNANGTENTRGTQCVSCHGKHNIQSPNKKGTKWSKEKIPESCGICHKDKRNDYLLSNHYEALEKGMKGAPNCLSCHESRLLKIDVHTDTLQVKLSEEKLCLSCHLDKPEVRKRIGLSTKFISSYESSVHGNALNNGNSKAANCVDCHKQHKILDGENPSSTVYKGNISNTCSQCHFDISKIYTQSIHGVAVANNNFEAPVCTDCHGEHNILSPENPESRVSFKNVSEEVCSPCHSSVKLSVKFGIKSDRYKSYTDSYHGLALEGGSIRVANCVSCHSAHDIKPASDPTSSINKSNLVKTCGKCHPGANKNFTVGKIHVNIKEKDEPILALIASLYMILIISVIGIMFIHNIVDLYRKGKIKKMKQRGLIKEEHHIGHALYLRMNLNERIQHIVMAVSFILLVITGFMLRFPNTWWVSHIIDLSKDAFEYRSLVHRVAAVFMVGVSLYHIFYVSFTPRGRQLIKDLFPRYKDVQDAVGIAKFNLGISKEKPKLDRFSYVEKAEYWALVWGTIIMTATGVIMWFENTFIGLFTKLGWDIANTIHYYEAWLAFLAIVVWHFYFVIFNPDVYPMSLAWLKGTITVEEMAEEHPLELERLKEKENKSEPDNSNSRNK